MSLKAIKPSNEDSIFDVQRPDIQPRKRVRPAVKVSTTVAVTTTERRTTDIEEAETVQQKEAGKRTRKNKPSSESEQVSAADERQPAKSADYNIGYRKPPKHSRFKPGQSGNPKGRPKGARSLQTIVRELMTQKVPIRTAKGIKKMTHMEALMHKALEQGYAGNLRALTSIIQLYAQSVPNEEAPPLESFDADQSALINQMLSEAGFDHEPVKRKTDRSTPDEEVGA